jgi:phosphoribosylpyrophosphate synthetase
LKKHSDKIKVISVADLFADIMKKVTSHESISEAFIC